jgi:hypothetical protein
MTKTISESDIADFITNAPWAVCSTHHTVFNASPRSVVFGRDMMFDVPFNPTGTKLRDIGNTKWIATLPMRIMSRLNRILKLVIKCWLNRWLSQQIRKLV